MQINTESLVRTAIKLSEASALTILNHPELDCNQKWIVGYAWTPELWQAILYFKFGDYKEGTWHIPASGMPQMDYDLTIAKRNAKKALSLIKSEKECTSAVIERRPWSLQDKFDQAAGIYEDSISVAVSGENYRVNEAIARIVVTNIRMLAYINCKH